MYSSGQKFLCAESGLFDTYDTEALYSYCKMRLDNGAAVVRFKFSTQEAYNEATENGYRRVILIVWQSIIFSFMGWSLWSIITDFWKI